MLQSFLTQTNKWSTICSHCSFIWYVYFCVQLLRGCFWKKKMCLTIMWYIRHIVICNSLFQCGKQFGGGSSFGWINHLIQIHLCRHSHFIVTGSNPFVSTHWSCKHVGQKSFMSFKSSIFDRRGLEDTDCYLVVEVVFVSCSRLTCLAVL